MLLPLFLRSLPLILCLVFSTGVRLHAQTADPAPAPEKPPVSSEITNPTVAKPGLTPVDHRVFGVLPNYRTANDQAPFVRLTTKQKFTIAYKDSTDYPVFITTAFFTGLSQAQGSDNQIYGQGTAGFFHRYALNYVDQVVGNFFPEAFVPVIVHEDPRYFRKGTGPIRSRLFYAVSRIFVCKTDNGNVAFNAPELVGNSLASMVWVTYHPHERTLGDAAEQFSTYTLTDMAGQLAKEFWPDVKRWYHNRHHPNDSAAAAIPIQR